MEELIITTDMREKINNYLGYELIKKSEVGHHLYDEAPGLGKIGIEGIELKDVVTNKQLDSNGNVEWYKNPHPHTRPGKIKPFHCKLTTISAKKSKVLIASLFPEETLDKKFLEENEDAIANLRRQLHIITNRKRVHRETAHPRKLPPLIKPKEMFLEGAIFCYTEEDEKPPAFLLWKEFWR